MSMTGVNTTTSNVQWQGNDKVGGVDPGALKTGMGIHSGSGQAPGVNPMAFANDIMKSVDRITSSNKLSGDQVDVLIATIMAKIKDATDKVERTKINTDQVVKQQAVEQKSAKLKEAEEKIKEAEDKMKHASVWDKIKLAFAYLGAILTIIAGLALAIGSGGAGCAAGICLVMAGVLMLGLAVDQTVQTAEQDQGKPALGMFGLMAKADAMRRGESEEDADAYAQKAQMGVQIGLMGAALLLSLPAMVPAAADMVASAGELAADVANFAVELTSMGEETATSLTEASEALSEGVAAFKQAWNGVEDGEAAADDVAKAWSEMSNLEKLKKGAEVSQKVVTTGMQIGDGVATAGSAAYHFEATQLQSQAGHLQSDAKQFQAIQMFLDDQIDAAIQRLKASGDRFNAMMDALVDAVKDRGDTMAHMKFRA